MLVIYKDYNLVTISMNYTQLQMPLKQRTGTTDTEPKI